jgi:hypothetical protein
MPNQSTESPASSAMSSRLFPVSVLFCFFAFSGCGATVRSVRGEWTGQTRAITAINLPHTADAVYFEMTDPDRSGRIGGVLVDEKRRLLSKRYLGRVLSVRGTIKLASAIDPTTGMEYGSVIGSDGKPLLCAVLVCRAKDIVDLGPAR